MPLKLLTVHFQFVLGVGQLAQQVLHLVLFFAVLSHQIIVFAHQALILASLVRVKLIQSHLHLLVDAGQLILEVLGLLFNLFSLQEDFIQFSFEFIVLVFYVLVGHFDIFRPGVHSEFIEGEVVVSELAFEIPDFGGETFESLFKFVVELLFFVDGLGFGSEFLGFFLNVHHLLFNLGHVVIAIVHFSLSGYSLGTVDTATCGQWSLLDFDCCSDSSQRIKSLNHWKFTLMAVPCRETAACWAPNLGLIEVPALDPMDILFRFGSIFQILNNKQCSFV